MGRESEKGVEEEKGEGEEGGRGGGGGGGGREGGRGSERPENEEDPYRTGLVGVPLRAPPPRLWGRVSGSLEPLLRRPSGFHWSRSRGLFGEDPGLCECRYWSIHKNFDDSNPARQCTVVY